MRAALKSLVFLPEPSTLPDDPASFAFEAELGCGPGDGPGEEVFGLTVCTGEWLAARCAEQGGVFDARHHLVIAYEQFDQHLLRHWLETRVSAATGGTWSEVAEELSKTGRWELDTHSA